MTSMLAQPYLSIFNIILVCILSIAIYNLKKKGYEWLVLLLLSYGSLSFLNWGILIENNFIVVFLPTIFFPIAFFQGSAILLYTDRVLFDNKKQKIHWHLIVPGIIFFIHITLIIVMPDQWSVAQIKNQTGIHRGYTMMVGICMGVYTITFSLISLFRIITYKKRYRDNFSDDMLKNIQWLFYFVLLNLGMLILRTSVLIYYIVKNVGIPFSSVEETVLLVILLSFIYYLITKPEILPLHNESKAKLEKKYAKVNLSNITRKQYAKELEAYMLQKHAFLDEKISISQISESINIPRHHLSMTINIEFEQNFYSYVNYHRIRYAENLLKDSKKRDESILMIAYNSGFQSKAPFNKAFKFLNGMTPSEYRKIHFSKI